MNQTSDHNPGLEDLDKLDLGKRAKPASTQLMLFDAAESAITGEV